MSTNINLFEKYGRKRYTLSQNFSSVMKSYISNTDKKSFKRQMRRLVRGDISERSEILIELSSICTHYLIACNIMDKYPSDLDIIVNGILSYNNGSDEFYTTLVSELNSMLLGEEV